MPNIVAIIQDDRIRRQAEQFMQELGMDDLRLATFRTQEEFADLYWRDRKQLQQAETPPEEGQPPQEGQEGADLKLFSEIHLVLFALDTIGEKTNIWLDKLKTNFKRFGFWPEQGQLRTILLKYEDDGVSKLDVLHPILDDLIYLPLDRLIFLQKMQILLGLPKITKPTYLFNQEVNMEIEISKISKMDRLSDVGLAIRNPIPLRKGLPGHFYVQLPGDKNRIEMRGKVFRSEPHPEHPGQYLVYFTFFGLGKNELTRIRQSLSKSTRYQSLYSDDRALFRFRSDDLFLTAEEMKVFGVAIIDSDEAAATHLAQQLAKDMDRLKVVTENSYQGFLHKYFENVDEAPTRPTEAGDFFHEPVTLTIQVDGLKCARVTPQPAAGALLLGHPAAELFSTPDKWMTLFADKATHSIFEEGVQLAALARKSERLFGLNDAQGERRSVKLVFKSGSSPGTVDVEMGPASLSDIVEKTTPEGKQKELEVLIMDSSFVPDDPAPTIEGLRQRAQQAGLVKAAGDLKFFVMADGDARAGGPLLANPDILGLLLKPVDSRQLSFLLSEYLPNKNTVYQFDNLGWSQPVLPVHVSKGVHLEALSEFGATLRSRQPLVAGTVVYLRRSIYDNAPNACLAARVYACEPHPSEKDFFQVYLTYFGINDQFLKFARTWIRENYAQQKEKEGGG